MREPYIPGGGQPRPPPLPAGLDALDVFARGVGLFERGFVWEAHEAWEMVWVIEGRQGPRADLIKALIKIAAARVKFAQGVHLGVESHAAGAIKILDGVQESSYGVDLDAAREFAHALLNEHELPSRSLVAPTS